MSLHEVELAVLGEFEESADITYRHLAVAVDEGDIGSTGFAQPGSKVPSHHALLGLGPTANPAVGCCEFPDDLGCAI